MSYPTRVEHERLKADHERLKIEHERLKITVDELQRVQEASQRELRVQFQRIAEMQAILDEHRITDQRR